MWELLDDRRMLAEENFQEGTNYSIETVLDGVCSSKIKFKGTCQRIKPPLFSTGIHILNKD